MKRIFLLWFVHYFYIINSANGQGIIEPKHSFTLELGLPNTFTNKAFREIMQGLVHVSPNYQYAFKNGFALGVGGRYSYFAINEFRVPSKVFGGNHSFGGFVKIGHEKFYSELFAIDAGVKLGYAQNIFYSDLLRSRGIDVVSKASIYVEPIIGLVLASSESDTYRFSIGYSFFNNSFKPWDIGFEEGNEIGYTAKELSHISSFLTVGFGYTHHFNGKASTGFEE